jgi:hypothetical protein
VETAGNRNVQTRTYKQEIQLIEVGRIGQAVRGASIDAGAFGLAARCGRLAKYKYIWITEGQMRWRGSDTANYYAFLCSNGNANRHSVTFICISTVGEYTAVLIDPTSGNSVDLNQMNVEAR